MGGLPLTFDSRPYNRSAVHYSAACDKNVRRSLFRFVTRLMDGRTDGQTDGLLIGRLHADAKLQRGKIILR